MVLIYIVVLLITVNILETIWLKMRHSNHAARTSRVAASIIGIIAGFIGMEHGYYEILQRDKSLNGILFDAISGKSFSNLPTSQWSGWPAMTLIQNFLITGIFAILVALVVMTWAAFVYSEKERRPDADFAVNSSSPGGWRFLSACLWNNRRSD